MIRIRDATRADLGAIVAIYNASIPDRLATADTEPVSVTGRLGWFEEHDRATRPLWVAEIEGEIVGWLSFQSFYGRPAYFRTAEISIYVARFYRRRGIGRQLLQDAIARSPDLDLSVLLGFIFAHNQPSLTLFRGLGFQQWGYLPKVAQLDGVERDLAILGRRVEGEMGR